MIPKFIMKALTVSNVAYTKIFDISLRFLTKLTFTSQQQMASNESSISEYFADGEFFYPPDHRQKASFDKDKV